MTKHLQVALTLTLSLLSGLALSSPHQAPSEDAHSFNESAVCAFDSFMGQDNSCHECFQNQCSVSFWPSITVTVTDRFDLVGLAISIQLSASANIASTADSLDALLTINDQTFHQEMKINAQSNLLTTEIANLNQQKAYQVSLQSLNASYLLISSNNATFLWFPKMDTISVEGPVTIGSVLSLLAPIFSHTSIIFPFLIVSAMISSSSGIFSLFQTSSMVYLIALMKLEPFYDDVKMIIKETLVLHPEAAFRFISPEMIGKAPIHHHLSSNFHQQLATSGNYYLVSGLNSVISHFAILLLATVLIKLGKKISVNSGNQVNPEHYQCPLHLQESILRRSKVRKNGQIRWTWPVQVSERATFRQKVYFKLCLIDHDKWIVFFSVIGTELLAQFILIFHELSQPMTSIVPFVSSSVASLIILLLILSPLILLNSEPFFIFKSAQIIDKRKQYTPVSIWFWYSLVKTEPFLLSLVMVLSPSQVVQIALILTVQVMKLVVIKNVLKKVEVIKILLFISCFGSVTLSNFLTHSLLIKFFIIGSIIALMVIDLWKILCGLLILIIDFFTNPKHSRSHNGSKQLGQERNTQPEGQVSTVPHKKQTLRVEHLRKESHDRLKGQILQAEQIRVRKLQQKKTVSKIN